MKNSLEGNIVKYSLYKIFTKRVYLPLIAVYLTTIGKTTLPQLALIVSITGIVSIIMEIPSGYLSDKWGHKNALIFGSFLCMISPLFYIISPNFIGGLLASALFFGGASFTSGTIQAFIHETLIALGKDSEYAAIMGKSQSYGLLGNILLVSLIPLTYSIHPSIPFILGFVCLAAAFGLVLSFKKPPVTISETAETAHFFKDLRSNFSWQAIFGFVLIFIVFGIITAGLDSATIYREIVFTDLGIPVKYFGFILAFGSLLAALVGRNIGYLKKMRPTYFYLFDIAYMFIVFVLIGISKNALLTAFIFCLIPAYGRTRSIIFESLLFEKFPKSAFKSTLVSIMNFFSIGNSIWIPALFGLIVAKTTVHTGYLYFGIALFITSIITLSAYFTIKPSDIATEGL